MQGTAVIAAYCQSFVDTEPKVEVPRQIVQETTTATNKTAQPQPTVQLPEVPTETTAASPGQPSQQPKPQQPEAPPLEPKGTEATRHQRPPRQIQQLQSGMQRKGTGMQMEQPQ